MNVWIFAALYLGTWPQFLYGSFRVAQELHAHQKPSLWWIGNVLFAQLAPFIYIAFWGKDVKPFVRVLMVIGLIVLGAVTVYTVLHQH